MTTRRMKALGCACTAALVTQAFSQTPTVNGKIQFLGTCSYVKDDWDERQPVTGQDNIVVMSKGLRVHTVGGDPGDVWATQYKKGATPGTGKTSVVRFRGIVEHIPGTEAKLGLYSTIGGGGGTEGDPWANPPDAAVYFDMIETEGDVLDVYGVTKKAGGTALSTFLFSWSKEENPRFVDHDLVVKLEGVNKVTFYYKKSHESGWTATQITDTSRIPDSTTPLRLSIAVRSTDAKLNNLTARMLEFEADD